MASIDLLTYLKTKTETLIYTKLILIGTPNSNNNRILSGSFFSFKMTYPNINDISKTLKLPHLNLKKFKKKDIEHLLKKYKFNLSNFFCKIDIEKYSHFHKSICETKSDTICKLIQVKLISSLIDIRLQLYEYQILNENLDDLIQSITEYFYNIDKSMFSSKKKIKLTSIMGDYSAKKNRHFKEIVHIEALILSIFKLFHSNEL